MPDERSQLLSIQRYVAMGDSQTEGLHDYDPSGALRGWADRFAEQLARSNPELLYANLAVRGKRTQQIHEEQLAAAVKLAPDLVTVVAGVNDVLRPGMDVESVTDLIETMYTELGRTGSIVMGCTFPLPAVGLSRRIAPRLQALNASIRRTAERCGVLLVELEGIPAASDLRLWSADRIHLNAEGHHRLASAFDVRLQGFEDDRWIEPLPDLPDPGTLRQIGREAVWITRFLVPKIVRTLRGRSSGDGRSAKRPQLRRVSPETESPDPSRVSPETESPDPGRGRLSMEP